MSTYVCIEAENSHFINYHNNLQDKKPIKIDAKDKFEADLISDEDIHVKMLTQATSVNVFVGLCPDICAIAE